jgi:pimeloyl-ACP methyl ester carboxylesterase
MEGPGLDAVMQLSDGRTLDYWEGGDPDGRGVIFHGGTPCTNVFGRHAHAAAVAEGVRLVAPNRPGYGSSDLPSGAPSLLTTGRDTAELAQHLGLSGYAVIGVSGGGPFAVATACADPDGVRAVGVVAGIGQWRLFNPAAEDVSDEEIEERGFLALLDAGDVAAARDGFMRNAVEELNALVGLDDEARVDAFFGGHGPQEPYGRSLWAVSLSDVVARPDGYVFDNLAWGAVWDVHPRDVVAPTSLWYGDADDACPSAIGEWYADQITGSELTVRPGEDHMAVCSNHWAEQLSTLLDRWAT